jgi:hypothetical protein
VCFDEGVQLTGFEIQSAFDPDMRQRTVAHSPANGYCGNTQYRGRSLDLKERRKSEIVRGNGLHGGHPSLEATICTACERRLGANASVGLFMAPFGSSRAKHPMNSAIAAGRRPARPARMAVYRMPAAAMRRRIIRQALAYTTGCPVGTVVIYATPNRTK